MLTVVRRTKEGDKPCGGVLTIYEALKTNDSAVKLLGAETLRADSLILDRPQQEDLVVDSVSPNFLVRNWPWRSHGRRHEHDLAAPATPDVVPGFRWTVEITPQHERGHSSSSGA